MTSSNLSAFLLVGLGGAFGSVLRFSLSTWMNGLSSAEGGAASFPTGTLAVNLLGCLCIGLIAGLLEHRESADPLRLLIMTGVLGGFTTFSAFGLETFGLLRAHEPLMALSYVTASVIGGLALVWLGWGLTSA